MTMEGSNSEIESFLTKFKSLLYSGYNATLTLESKKGEAFICLKAGLGPVSIPSSSDCKAQTSQKLKPLKHRSPSYRRRQERRRKSFEASHGIKEYSSSNVSDALSNSGAVIPEETDLEVSVIEENKDNADAVYACDSCEFVSTWKNGLLIHVASAHEVSRQKNRALRSAEDEVVFDLTQQYWKTGILERNHQVYINALIDVEQSNVSETIMAEEERKLENLWNHENSSPT